MNLNEFKGWYKTHTGKFPNVATFFKGLGAKKEQVWNEWFRLLSNIDADDALGASQRMQESPSLSDTYPQNHASKIRELVTGISAARADSFSRNCMCGGSGMVEVVNNALFKTPSGNVITTPTVTVLCKCDKGRWMHERQDEAHRLKPLERPPAMVQFDDSWMTTWDEHLRQQKTGLDVYEPQAAARLADGWGSLPEYQPSLYEVREPGEEG